MIQFYDHFAVLPPLPPHAVVHWCILRFYPLLLFTLSAKKHKFTNLRFYGFTANFANWPNLPFCAPKTARSDRKFTNLQFYGAFLGSNGIYHFTVLPFYGAPWQKTCLRPAPCTQIPQSNGTNPENTYAQTAPKNGPCSTSGPYVHLQKVSQRFNAAHLRFMIMAMPMQQGQWNGNNQMQWQQQPQQGATGAWDARQGHQAGLGSGPGPGFNLGCRATSQTGDFWLNFHQKLVISPHEKEGLTAQMGQMGLGLAPVSCFSHQDSW